MFPNWPDEPLARAEAIRRLRFRDLKDATVLRALLRACRDEREVPGTTAGGDDPFGAFFGSARRVGTLAEIAAKRLDQIGFPVDCASIVAEVLSESGAPGELPRLVGRAIGETRWPDPAAALQILVPALDRWDVPLFESISRLGESTYPVLASLASRPLRLRLVQELLNHPGAHPHVVASLQTAACDASDPPTDAALNDVIGVLAAWRSPAAPAIAAALGRERPWLVAWQSLSDAEAAAAFGTWLESGASGAPPGVLVRLAEVLRGTEVPPAFPLAQLLAVLGEEHGLATGAALEDAAVVTLLERWVTELARGDGVTRGWRAVRRLVEAGKHGRVGDALSEALRLTDPARAVPWEADLLLALATARPAIDGVDDALQIGLRSDPSAAAVAVPALLQRPAAACADAAAIVIGAAESAPLRVERVDAFAVREVREGVDLDGIAAVVERADRPTLTARFENVRPVLRAG